MSENTESKSGGQMSEQPSMIGSFNGNLHRVISERDELRAKLEAAFVITEKGKLWLRLN